MRVIVIGGGIVGGSAAYHLARRGVSTTLVDATHKGQATSAGAGIIFPWPFPGDSPQVREFSLRAAAHYPSLMAELAADGLPTGYEVVGGVSVGDDATRDDDYQAVAAMAAQPGYEGMGTVERLEPGEPARRFPALRESFSGVGVSGAARLDGKRAVEALLDAAEERGARLLTGDAELRTEAGRVTGVRAAGEEHTGDAVIVAAGAWTAPLLRPLGVEVPVYPVRGQIAHVALPDQSTGDWPTVQIPRAGQYLLTFPPNRVVLSGTREHDAGFDARLTTSGLHRVLGDALDIAPGLADATLAETRVGFRPGSRDGQPILGPVEGLPGLVVATGLGAEGLTLGPYQGAVAAQLALGEAPETDLSAFRPNRAVHRDAEAVGE